MQNKGNKMSYDKDQPFEQRIKVNIAETKFEEFCEKKYVIEGEKESNPVDINIEELMKNEKQKHNKFSTELVPTIVANMEPPDFLDETIEEDQQDTLVEETTSYQEPERLPPVIIDEEDSDFEIPEANDEVGDLRNF